MQTCPSATPCRDLAFPCAGAAHRGHLDCLKRAREEDGAAWDVRVTSSAAREGHLDCLKYAHENGCPWGEDACAGAARRGKLDCLRYAHENGCPVDWLTHDAVNAGGHAGCQEYLRERGCPGGGGDVDNDEVRVARLTLDNLVDDDGAEDGDGDNAEGRGGLLYDTLWSRARTGRMDESDIERIREELDGIDIERIRDDPFCLFTDVFTFLPDTSLEPTAEENAPQLSIEEVAAGIRNEQLRADDAHLKSVNKILSEHFKLLSEATGNSAYGAVSLMIDEYATVVGQQIERGTDISSRRDDRPEFWIHVAELIDDVLRRCSRR
jgi:hypothetical protein